MNAQTIAPAPELHPDPNPRPERDPAPELLVQYPKSEPIAVTLSRQTFWDELVETARNRIGADRPNAADGKAAELVRAPELGSSLSWIAVVTGVLLFGALWSAILF